MINSAFLSKHAPFCPKNLLDRARAVRTAPFRLAIAHAASPLPMATAKAAYEEGIATPILIGETAEIKQHAAALDWDLTGITIHDSHDKKDSLDRALTIIRDGEADAIMKGNLHTDVFMAGIIAKDTGLRGMGRMVYISAMFHPDGGTPLLISDAAVNVAPNHKTRQQMVIKLNEVAQVLGIKTPRIAIISATEVAIASMPSSLEAKELSDWAQENVKDAIVNGPLSFDLAISPAAVAIKGVSNANLVAGRADALVMPDIESANVLFKSMVWYNGACVAGVVVGGRVPIILTSRADSMESRLASIALTSLI
ncbi:MAG: phosphate acyltransferase [Candidatus Puniceispirillales bacterium WSBS_2018_MAG_OTU23]